MKTIALVNVLISLNSVLCRDFYVGMFRRDDFLVAQDNVYRERRPHSFVQAEYGRLFKCPITYFRVVDRLGVGAGPTVRVVRGGLRKKYIAVRIKSGFGMPVSVNIYVGCGNAHPRTPHRPWKETTIDTTGATETGGTGQTGGTGDTGATDGTGGTGGEGGGEDGVTAAGEGGEDATTAAEGVEGEEATAEPSPDGEE